ncbi:MAG TPA: phytanoyl-CoA dioxygenase family protein [Thermoanaerobaculia bacterium]|nr:phytanoyl-CoA dioxygenase family protein [Thermoanaerobaculia bacterium]
MRSVLQKILRRQPQAAASSPLTPAGLLASDLWVDQPDAQRRIESRLKRGEIGAEQAEKLRHFVERGYLTFASALPERVYGELAEDIERVWREKPADLAYASQGRLRSFAEAESGRDRRPSYRIADLYSHSAAAREIYLWRPIFDYVELILGGPAVATQALYFEYGSQQALHRDPVFVQTRPPSHLLAAWVALEDIDPKSGPLIYVPGSHRLPYYQFEPGEHRFDHGRYGERESNAMAEFDREQVRAHGLGSETLTCRRGEVLIWHSSLLHGGSPVEDPARTRKSFVIHFSTLGTYKLRRQSLVELVPGPGGELVERPRIFETETLLEAGGCRGFANPVVGYRPPGV